jgi:bifunctional DNA-binding transcriptional regulator/antitoxin component of YhaV-PrlF toxin-antitoxin module
MSHDSRSSHIDHPIRLGDRGRLVLPAELRRALDVSTGDELVARLDGDGVRIVSRRQLARQARGMLAGIGRDLASELMAERRLEADGEG